MLTYLFVGDKLTTMTTYLDETFLDDNVTDYEKRRNRMSKRRKAVLGTIFGQAVGDALGAPFEFGPPGKYTEAFPDPIYTGNAEMIGGGAFNWKPGEFTDDTQMAIIGMEAVSLYVDLIEDQHYAGFLEYLYGRFAQWAQTANDVGSTTRGSLHGGNWQSGAKAQHERAGFSASNGSVMRTGPIMAAAIALDVPQAYAIEMAFHQSRLTHWDMKAAISSAFLAGLIDELIFASQDFNDWRDDFNKMLFSARRSVGEVLHGLGVPAEEVHDVFEYVCDWNPTVGGPTNGHAITCLGQAIYSVKVASTFEKAVTTAINLGHDTDTVAAVTGSIAGARWGIDGIPFRWVTLVNGEVLMHDKRTIDHLHLKQTGRRGEHVFNHGSLMEYSLSFLGETGSVGHLEPAAGPRQLHPDVPIFAANLTAMPKVEDEHDLSVLSLCRTDGLTDHISERRNVYIIDTEGANDHLEDTVKEAVATINEWLRKGRKVIVHCHAGRSRTGFILKAWYMDWFGATHEEAHEWLSGEWPIYAPHGNFDFSDYLDEVSYFVKTIK